MMEERLDNDLAKELLIVLSYCDTNLIKNIPDSFINNLTNMAADSDKEIYIDSTKELSEQNISEECKDLLSIIYYMYVAQDKDYVIDCWIKNN